MDTLTWMLISCLGTLAAGTLLYLCLKRFELAVSLVVLSPWVSAVFIPNVGDLSVFEESTIGSYLRVGFIVLAGVSGGARFLLARPSKSAGIPMHFLVLGGYSLLALGSTFYSIDLQFSIIRSLTFAAFFIFLMGLHGWLSEGDRCTQLLNMLVSTVVLCLLVNLLSVFFAPGKAWSFEAGNRFQGLWGHPNAMGAFLMISYPILYWKMTRASVRQRLLIGGLSLWMMVMHLMTGSRTSMLTTVIGLAVWYFVQRKGIRLIVTSILAALGLLLVVLLQPQKLYRETDQGMAGLTGRPEIWAAAITLAKEHPLRGFGFEVAGKIFEDPRFQDRELSLWMGSARVSLHNGYLSVIVGLGIPGFLVLFVALLIPFWRGRSLSPEEDIKPLLFSVLVMCLLANLTESVIGNPAAMTSVVLWLLWVVTGRLTVDSKQREAGAGTVTPAGRQPVFPPLSDGRGLEG